METPVVNTPTPTPSFAELRAMVSAEPPAPAAAEPKTESSVTPAAVEPAVEPKPAAASEPVTPEPVVKTESAIDRRFSKLSRQRDEARQREEATRRELEALKAAQPGPAAATPAEPAKVAAVSKPVPPDPGKWTGTWEELETAKLEYAEKLADYKVAEALKTRDQAEQNRQTEAAQKTVHAKWEERAAATLEKHPDFQDAIEEIGPFVTKAGVADLIKQSEVGPEIVLYLHQHADEAMKIAKLGNPVAIAREIGRLEHQLTPASKTAAPAPKAALPKPPASVAGGGSAAASVDLNSCDMATFKREAGRLIKA